MWGPVGLTLSLTLGAGSSGLSQTLNGVTAERTPSGLEIVIMGEGLKKPRLVRFADGKELMFKFKGVLQGSPGKQEFATGAVRTISYGWFDKRAKETGLIAKLKAASEPKIKEAIGGWIIQFAYPATAAVASFKPQVKPRAAIPFAPIYSEDELYASVGGVPTELEWAPSNSSAAVLPPATPIKVPLEFLLAVPTVFTKAAGQTKGLVAPLTIGKVVDKTKASTDKKPGDKKERPTDPMSRLVTLDFTNTDVVQILKAITLQAGVNIVAAKDVNQTISVSLDKVTVLEALNLVTEVAKLTYRKQGNAIVVSSRAEATTIIPTHEPDPAFANRVVPLASGQGKQIRAVLTAWLNAQPSMRGFQVFLPEDNFSIERQANAAGGPAVSDVKLGQASTQEGKADSGQGTQDSIVRFNGLKDQYLMVIGPSAGMDTVVKQITEADHMIAKAYGHGQEVDDQIVTHSYSVKTEKTTAADLVKAVTSDNSSLNVDLIASPKGFVNQVVVLVGRESNVKRAEEMLSRLDSSGYGSEIVSYEVKATDPRSLREALVSAIPGLRVTVAPNPVSNSSLYKEGEGKKQGQDTQSSQTQQSSQTASGAASSSSAVNTDGALESPFNEQEKNAFPMRLFLRGTTDQIREAHMLLEKMDIAPKQVAIELRVMELSKDDSINAGIDWNILGGGAVKFLNMNNSQPQPLNTIGASITGRKFSGDVTASLDALAAHNKLLARPNFTVIDGRQGEVFVGDIVRYIESITQSQSGTTIVTGEVSVGVRLCVIPRIGGDGKITLDLRPRISLLKGFTDVPNGGKLPQTSSRYAQTTLMVESGQTIAIGGLIQDQDSMTNQGVPFLKDLPIFGSLFKKTTGERKRTELVIFLTVKTIDNANNGENIYMPTVEKPTPVPAKGGRKRL